MATEQSPVPGLRTKNASFPSDKPRLCTLPNPSICSCIWQARDGKKSMCKAERGVPVKEGSTFLLVLRDLYWFRNNRDVLRLLTMLSEGVSALPAAEETLWPSSVRGNWSPEPQPSLWLLGWNQWKSSSRESVPLPVCKENLFASVEPYHRHLVLQPWVSRYRPCWVRGSVLLAAAEPRSPRARGLGVTSAVPLALRIPLTALTACLREASTEHELLGQSQERV